MERKAFDNSGALYKNDRKREGKNDPEMTGQLTIQGKKYWLSAWAKEGSQGRPRWLSISVKAQDGTTHQSDEVF